MQVDTGKLIKKCINFFKFSRVSPGAHQLTKKPEDSGYKIVVYVEPRFNEVPRDWGNWFVISSFCSIHFTVTLAGLDNNYCSLYRGLCYIEVR